MQMRTANMLNNASGMVHKSQVGSTCRHYDAEPQKGIWQGSSVPQWFFVEFKNKPDIVGVNRGGIQI
jgi:hypothetical protein